MSYLFVSFIFTQFKVLEKVFGILEGGKMNFY